MQNALKHAMTGGANNPEYLFDPAGNVVCMRDWSNPEQLRKDLVTLVGEIENPTPARDVPLRFLPPKSTLPKGIVPKLKHIKQLDAVTVHPEDDGGQPYYVKLRAEADSDLLDRNQGKLYLGFHLDPIYEVHWNNLVSPIEFAMELPIGVSITPSRGKGPKLNNATDADPREFLLDVSTSNTPFFVTIKYFACNDKEGSCKPIIQTF